MRTPTHPDTNSDPELNVLAASVDSGVAIYDVMICGVVVHDGLGTIVYANPAAQDLLGLSLDQLQGRTAFDPRWCVTREDGSAFPGNDHPTMVALRTGQPQRGVTMGIARPSGERCWLQVDVAPMLDDQGVVTQVVVSFTDVSAHKRMEEVLHHEIERRTAIIATHQEVASAGLDLEGVLTQITERAQVLTGASGAVVEMIEGEEMVYRAASGTVVPHLGLRLASATSLSGLCTRIGEVLRCDDSETDERVDRAACRRINVRSMVVVPLQQSGETVGVLKVLSPQPQAFNLDDVEALQIVAGVLGGALGQAATFDALRASEERYRQIQEYAPIGMALVAPDGRWLRVNPSLRALVGYTEEELLARTFQDITYPDDLDADLALVHRVLAGEVASYQMEKRYVRKDGSLVWVQFSVSLVRDETGQPLYFIAQIQDIDQRRRAEDALRRAEERFRALSAHATDLVAIVDRGGTLTYTSPSHEAVLGYESDVLVGGQVLAYTHPDDIPSVQAAFAVCLRRPGTLTTVELRLRHADGTWRTLESILHNGCDEPAIGGVVVTSRDVTVRVRQTEALAYEATHDTLTGLPNRVLLHDRLGQALRAGSRSGESVALLLMDLDRFKDVNDTFGHDAGDALLIEVARRVRGSVRTSDTAARLGGDEFALVLPTADAAGATQVATVILRALTTPIHVGGHEVSVGSSIGIAVYRAHGDDAATLLRHADIAMYAAKHTGGGSAVYSDEDSSSGPLIA